MAIQILNVNMPDLTAIRAVNADTSAIEAVVKNVAQLAQAPQVGSGAIKAIRAVNADTSAIEAAGKTATKVVQDGEKMVALAVMRNYMLDTRPVLGRPRELPEEDRPEVIEHVKKLKANGWLEDEHIQWCQENNIPIE